MAKDPAFLFYSRDFYEGTRTMLPEERACYMDLMIYQHQHGKIPAYLKRVLMYCSGVDEATLKATLVAKFKQDKEGWTDKNPCYRFLFKCSGPNHYNFKGVYETNRKLRQSPMYRKWKKEVLNRDNYQCQLCGSEKQLHAHHIKPFSIFPDLRFDVSNGLTLCSTCHLNTHKNG